MSKLRCPSLALAAVLAGILASACGGSDNASTAINDSSGSSGQGSPASAEKVTIVLTSPVAYNLPPFLAESGGHFTKAGVDVSVRFVGPNAIVPALLEGSTQFAVGAAPTLDLAALKSPKLRLVGTWAPRGPWQFVAASGINSVEDLSGTTMASPGLNTAPSVLVSKMLRDAGMSLSDVKTYVGQSISVLAPLFERGTIDGTFSSPPLTQQLLSVRSGAKVLHDFSSVDFTAAALAVNTQWAKTHSDAAVAVIRALDGALAEWHDNPDAAIEVIKTQSSVPRATAATAYEETLPVITTAVEPITTAQETSVLSLSAAAGVPGADPSRAASIVTDEYVRR